MNLHNRIRSVKSTTLRLYHMNLSGPQSWALALIGKLDVGPYQWSDVDPRTLRALAGRELIDGVDRHAQLTPAGKHIIEVVRATEPHMGE